MAVGVPVVIEGDGDLASERPLPDRPSFVVVESLPAQVDDLAERFDREDFPAWIQG